VPTKTTQLQVRIRGGRSHSRHSFLGEHTTLALISIRHVTVINTAEALKYGNMLVILTAGEVTRVSGNNERRALAERSIGRETSRFRIHTQIF
jgi:hypothetical protein